MKPFFKKLRNHLIPHKENNYEPHLLRHRSMLVVFLAVVVIELLFLVQVFIVFDKTKFLATVLPAVLTSLTNEKREASSAPLLKRNDFLQKAAQLKADDMAAGGYFAHVSPDGKSPWYWLDQVGYRYSYAGENLAVNFFESVDVVKAWMDSPAHRKNIIKKEFSEIGIGVASGIYEGKNTVFVVQFFGRPVAPVVEKEITVKNTTKIKPTIVLDSAKVPTGTKVLGEETTTEIAKVLTSPRQTVAYTYIGVVSFFLLLLLVFFIKSETRHPSIIIKCLGLVAIIFILLFINLRMLNLETTIPNDSETVNVIAR